MKILNDLNIDAWVIFGFIAQFVFFLRFVIQWYASEKAKKTVIPIKFWYLSLIGTSMLLVYSLYRKDIVFITASCLNFLIYFRNLTIRKKQESREKENTFDV